MAALTPHWQVVPSHTRALWGVVARLPQIQNFYLAGGTALALRMGHRISQDLDLFAPLETLDDALRQSIIAELEKGHRITLFRILLWVWS